MQDYYDHEGDSDSEDATLASELLLAGVPRMRVKGLFQDRMKDVDLDEIADTVLAHKRNRGAAMGAELPEIKQLVEKARAPNEYLDPLFMHLMKDPVVLSSGHVVDRSSALNEDGKLRFKRCPFSRVILKPDVYPLDEKKKQINSFKNQRDRAITTIARKLISNGSFENFSEVLEAVEDYLKDQGDSNYLPLARELANIWTGIGGKGDVPLFLFVDELKGQVRQNKWLSAIKSETIDFQVGRILVSVERIGDEGRSIHKTTKTMTLLNDKSSLTSEIEPQVQVTCLIIKIVSLNMRSQVADTN